MNNPYTPAKIQKAATAAVEGAMAGGMTVKRVKIDLKEGTVDILAEADATPEGAYEEWKANGSES